MNNAAGIQRPWLGIRIKLLKTKHSGLKSSQTKIHITYRRTTIKVMADLLFNVVIIKGLQHNSTFNNVKFSISSIQNYSKERSRKT